MSYRLQRLAMQSYFTFPKVLTYSRLHCSRNIFPKNNKINQNKNFQISNKLIFIFIQEKISFY